MAEKTSDKLAKMRERLAKPKGKGYVEPVLAADQQPQFNIEHWYQKIRSDPSPEMITMAGAYYDEAVRDGTHYIVPVGNLETLLLQQPGLAFFYKGILVDAQQSRRWLEERLDRLEAERHTYYMYSEEAKAEYGTLKTTDAAKLAKSDPEVKAMGDSVRVLAYHEHNLERLQEAFENLKYVLNHVTGLHKEGLEPVWVDATQETRNV